MIDGKGHRKQLALSAMTEELAEIEQQLDTVRVEHETLVKERAAMELSIESVRRRAASSGHEIVISTTDQDAPGAAPRVLSNSICFDGCANTHDRLVRMAEAWGGKVNAHDAALCLISNGISKGKQMHLVPALQKLMTDKEHLWEYVGPRTYRYLPYDDGLDGDAADPAERGPE